MSIHRLIREGRLRLGMSEHQFAAALDVSRGAVQQWEKQGGTAPNRANQPRVAKLLGISIAELVSGESYVGAGAYGRTEVPLVSDVDAQDFASFDNFKRTERFEMVRVTVPVRRHTYALRVHGDSMVSHFGDSFPEGVIIVVEPELKARPGDYVIALRDGDQTALRQLVRDDGRLYLKPLNARYPMKELGTAVIAGVVREFTKRFR